MSNHRYEFTVNLGVHGEIVEQVDLVDVWNISEDYLDSLSQSDLENKLKEIWEEIRDLSVGGSVKPLYGSSLQKEELLMGLSEQAR